MSETTTRTAWRACHPDLRSSHGFRWPLPGNEAVAPLPDSDEFTRGNPCPQFEGDGLCLAKTWAGAASGGISAITCLLVEFDEADVLGEDADKVRVSRCRVVDVFDAPALVRDGWCAGANLAGAYLTGANLGGAYLTRAYLGGAYLTRAYLTRANLAGADLGGADLGGAYLAGANLGGANLTRANLTRANLAGADLGGANLGGADLTRANLAGAYLAGANADRFTWWPDGFDPVTRGVTVR